MREWIRAALIRAVKTFAQTCVAMLPIGASIEQVSWLMVLGTGALAAVASLLTSVAGLPEVEAQESLALVRDGVISMQNDRSDNAYKED